MSLKSILFPFYKKFESFSMKKYIVDNDYNLTTKKTTEDYLDMVMSILINILFIGVAVFLSLTCTKNSNVFIRIIYAIFAALFPHFYIMYFAIYRVIMGAPCYITI
jgi:hypothetical protein